LGAEDGDDQMQRKGEMPDREGERTPAVVGRNGEKEVMVAC